MSGNGDHLKTAPYYHRGCGGVIVVSLDGESCSTCGAEIAGEDEAVAMVELPEVADASEEDLRLAVAVLGGLAMYGGFLRAVLAGIYAGREQGARLIEAEMNRPCAGGGLPGEVFALRYVVAKLREPR